MNINHKDCIFCKIISKQLNSYLVFKNDIVICFLPKEMEVYGHTLIVPKVHYANIYDIPQSLLSDLITTIKELSVLYKEKLNSTGINILHASGKDAQQSVAHFHFHLLPRFKDDGLNCWPSLKKVELDKEELINILTNNNKFI